MANNWNKEQEAAIQADLGNFLISASAGSGKTAVLTERVYRLIKEGTNLNQLLILTFTNLAAANMRDKIRNKLLEDGLVELASMLESVNIQTFDAFALFLVKKYYYRLNLRSSIKLVDEAIIRLEENKILDDIFNRFYEKEDQTFIDFVSSYSIKSDDDLRDLVFKIMAKLALSLNKEDTLDKYRTLYLDRNFIIKKVEDYLKVAVKTIEKDYEIARNLENLDYGECVIAYLENFLNITDYNTLHEAFVKNPDFPRTSKGKKSLADFPVDKANVQIIKDDLSSIKSALAYEDLETLIKQIQDKREHIEILLNIVKELDERITYFKNSHCAYTFNDIFKFAIKLAKLDDINADLKKQFKYIMIDEYQDTSDLQEAFISLFMNNNVFSVGDVKQSIYRFRNANPDIFLDKFVRYGAHSGGERIDLPKNYRSSEEVLETVNEIFDKLMDKDFTGLDYIKEHRMQAGNPDTNKKKEHTSTIMNEVIRYDLPEQTKAVEYEARLIATDIIRRKENKEQIYNTETKKYEEISYKNFAILMAKKTEFDVFQKVFEEYKIPLYADYKEPIHESDLTLVLESIIKALSYLDDVKNNNFRHAMFSILKSFLFSKDEEYIEDLLHSEHYEKCEAYASLRKIKEFITPNTSLKDIILLIIEEFKFNENIVKIGDISHSLDILSTYLDIASNMDELGYDLNAFNQYFEELKKFEIEPEFNASAALEDSVKLMSIHASKGLEFNFVYLPRLDTKGAGGSIDRFFVSSDYGVLLPNYAMKDHTNNFFHYLANKQERRENLLEKMRLFYVALTRAQEKIIFLMNNKNDKGKLYTHDKLGTFMDMFLMASPKLYETNIIPMSSENIEDKVRDEVISIKIKNITKMSKDIKVSKRASKDNESDDINTELLALGNKYHYYLELTDFKTKDVSFIKDNKDRELIERFLANDVFETNNLKEVLHEYAFYDEVNDINGVIDLMLVYNDHISIIDFKLSNVDDDLYERQVTIYKDYIATLTTLPIKTYIAGIYSNKVKEVK